MQKYMVEAQSKCLRHYWLYAYHHIVRLQQVLLLTPPLTGAGYIMENPLAALMPYCKKLQPSPAIGIWQGNFHQKT